MNATLYIIEDDRDCVELLKEVFSDQEYRLRCFLSSRQALETMKREGLPDLVLTDLMLPELDGISLLKEIRAMNPRLPVILMTAHASVQTAVEALKLGASDYITKPLNFEELLLTVRNSLELDRLRTRIAGLNKDRKSRYIPSALLGEHELIRASREMLIRLAGASTTSVMLRGESGSGKNLAARIIHYNSPLAEAPFVELNCAAVPASLIEAELFGYRRGSFTGAAADKEGIVEQADGGTLFLDEIAEVPLEVQSKLLSFLENRSFRRIGEVVERQVTVRLIAASNQSLESLIEQGRFRNDLFYRINVVSCELPPLRRLGRDVLSIAEKFVGEFNVQFNKQVSGLSPAAADCLLSHDWPGNVRELRNVIERAMLFAVGPRLERQDIQVASPVGETRAVGGFRIPEQGLDWEEHERETLVQALERSGNNQSRAARLLSMSRDTFIYRLKKFGLYH
ncbi:sigma-54 dependent transcriptional regulator [bacterium]|nr:sigma-54 dependent transcriptional regulator [bacterium]